MCYILTEDESVFIAKFELALEKVDMDDKPLMIFETADQALEALEKDEEGKMKGVFFVDISLKNSTRDGLDFINHINKNLGNGVLIGAVTKADQNKVYLGTEESLHNLSTVDALRLAGANFYMNKAGPGLEHRLRGFKRDLDAGYYKDLKRFKVYE